MNYCKTFFLIRFLLSLYRDEFILISVHCLLLLPKVGPFTYSFYITFFMLLMHLYNCPCNTKESLFFSDMLSRFKILNVKCKNKILLFYLRFFINFQKVYLQWCIFSTRCQDYTIVMIGETLKIVRIHWTHRWDLWK